MSNTASARVSRNLFLEQIVPISLTVLTAVGLCGLLWLEVGLLNRVARARIVPALRLGDVLLGLTIYLKTSVDFAIFIARLMEGNPGWRSRVAIEIGSAVGNVAGTMAVLAVWAFFKEVKPLLALMIFLASLVLFKLAEDGLEHAKTTDKKYPDWFKTAVYWLEFTLDRINKAIAPILRYVIPKFNMGGKQGLRFWPLLGFSFTVPFILGLDDFAGYVPVFNVVNVFGFSVGVVVGHMLLNVLLYL
ncbi:MAG: hypothetical protein JNK33_01530, partial [Candidatus Doudnabacteria bacterium]|nr:hypothetical protein [Candidatus Doudnabacteria bacterium]